MNTAFRTIQVGNTDIVLLTEARLEPISGLIEIWAIEWRTMTWKLIGKKKP